MNSSSDIYNGLFGYQTTGLANRDFISTNGAYTSPNGNYTNSISTYTKSIVSGNYTSINGNFNGQIHYNSNGINGHTDEEKSFINRAPKGLNLPDVLKNGLCSY